MLCFDFALLSFGRWHSFCDFVDLVAAFHASGYMAWHGMALVIVMVLLFGYLRHGMPGSISLLLYPRSSHLQSP